ncbi:MAG: hypothetical protein MK052_07590 [Alphaproteobacteria bacterium]|nr:hypothetical protein [Alphaproteobacteria bacterium]
MKIAAYYKHRIYVAALVLAMAMPAHTLHAEPGKRMIDASQRERSTSIEANAEFIKSGHININYMVQANKLSMNGNRLSHIAKIAVQVSELSTPVTMDCNIQSAKYNNRAESQKIRECGDFKNSKPTLLVAGDRHIQHIKMDKDINNNAIEIDDTMVISFSYL